MSDDDARAVGTVDGHAPTDDLAENAARAAEARGDTDAAERIRRLTADDRDDGPDSWAAGERAALRAEKATGCAGCGEQFTSPVRLTRHESMCVALKQTDREAVDAAMSRLTRADNIRTDGGEDTPDVCGRCGAGEHSPGPVVLGEFPRPDVADAFPNASLPDGDLVTLCDGCHAMLDYALGHPVDDDLIADADE